MTKIFTTKFQKVKLNSDICLAFSYRMMIKVDCIVKELVKRETWKARLALCMFTLRLGQIHMKVSLYGLL